MKNYLLVDTFNDKVAIFSTVEELTKHLQDAFEDGEYDDIECLGASVSVFTVENGAIVPCLYKSRNL